MLFGVLGPLLVTDGERPVPLSLAPKPRLLLAMLLAHAGRPVTVDALVDALWPEAPPASARRNLQLYVHQLRTELGPQLVATGPLGYAFADESTDAQRFRELISQATDQRGLEKLATLKTAIDLWRGPAFAEFLDCEPIADEAARLEQLRLSAYEGWAQAAVETDRAAEVVDDLQTLVRQHPFRETLTGHLMAALHAAGRAAEALAAYRETQAKLAEELGTDPGSALQKLHRAILRNELPGPARDVPRQLPPSALHFLGRDLEMGVLLAEIEQHASAGQTVVISAIDGMAGIGKTALAVHAAHSLATHYPHGQLFLDLHAHTQGRDPMAPTAALDTLLRAVGVDAERIPLSVD